MIGTSHTERLGPVDLICVNVEHISMGTSVPDGEGTLTVVERRWAYCSAGLRNVPHEWKKTGGVDFETISHSDLPAVPAAS